MGHAALHRYSPAMQANATARDQADYLIALHGRGAVEALVGRIEDAVRLCDDQAVGMLDEILRIVEARLEQPWRSPVIPVSPVSFPDSFQR